MRKVWFITGSSRGFGRELVRAALDTGDAVVATALTVADGYFYFGGQPIVTTHRQAHDERPGRPNRGGSIGS